MKIERGVKFTSDQNVCVFNMINIKITMFSLSIENRVQSLMTAWARKKNCWRATAHQYFNMCYELILTITETQRTE